MAGSVTERLARVTVIGPVYPYRGGIAQYTTWMSQALQQAGHPVQLLSFSRQYPRWLFPGSSDKDPSTLPLRADNAEFVLDSLNPVTWFGAMMRMRRFGAEIIVLQWWTTYWLPVWLTLLLLNRLFLRAKIVFICHNVLPHERRLGDRWITRQVLVGADACVVHSEAERNALAAILPHMPGIVTGMPAFPIFDTTQIEPATARQQLSLQPDMPVLLFFGIVRPYKALDDLLRALPAVIAVHPEVQLLVAGDFWGDPRLYMELIDELKIGSHVRLDNRYIPNELAAVYFAASDLFVAPYRRVTGSAALQAALATAIPVVVSDAISEDNCTAVHPGQIVLRVPTGDSDALAATINHFLATAPQRKRTSAPPDTSSWQRVVAAIESVSP